MQPPPDGHILIVEDDPDAREALVEFLIDGGYLPIAVADGVEALNHLRAGHRPSLIVLDLILPRIDGWRFLAWETLSDTPLRGAVTALTVALSVEWFRGDPRHGEYYTLLLLSALGAALLAGAASTGMAGAVRKCASVALMPCSTDTTGA